MELVEKWEQSGLLEGLTEKENLAYALESAASYMVDRSKNSEFSYTTAAAVTFPVIRRVLGNKNFKFEQLNSNLKFDVVKEFVSGPVSEYNEVYVCQSVSDRMTEKLKNFSNLKVHGVRTDVMKDGFEIQFLCS